MKHLVRLVGVLVGIVVVMFVVPRVMPKTAELMSFGFYPKSSEADTVVWANMPVSYADPATCGDCHKDKSTSWQSSKHFAVSCENCHGPGEQHRQTSEPLKVDKSADLCLICHGRVAGRRGDFPQVEPAQHARGANCISCHNPHSPKMAGPPATPHSVQGRDQCLMCHASGGLKPIPASHNGRTQDTCQSCHKSK